MSDLHNDAPAHWFSSGCAPNFSRRVAQAAASVDLAEANLLSTLKYAYPEGRRVQVFHYRGSFFGTVAGWNKHGCRVVVRNERSQKVSGWWAAQVQLADDDQVPK